jgi:NAD(P)-dependent dehydrogenase (short-subunit alcohol dehydrogenase family)
MGDFSGKTVIVTGGASGIGQAAAILFATHGANVVVADLDEKQGTATANNIVNDGGQAMFIRTDVSLPADCASLVQQTIDKYGRLDVAFNNAGIGGENANVADLSIGGWQKVIDINLNSVFYCMKYEIAEMLKNGAGCIVNMSSILGNVAFANSSAYVAAKHGVIGLTKSAAVEFATSGIRVNAVGPAFIDTPLLEHAGITGDIREALVAKHPIGRLGKSFEVAELVLWLASEKASFVTGSYYPVDGGYLAQ